MRAPENRNTVNNFIRKAFQFTKKNRTPTSTVFPVNETLSWLWNLPPCAPTSSATAKSVTWLIPDINTNSGGLLNIFRFNQLLEKKGYLTEFRILTQKPKHEKSKLSKLVNDHFYKTAGSISYGLENLSDSDFFIATYWTTAYHLKSIVTSKKKLYFVQDFEPHFYSIGCISNAVEQTYRMGFQAITAGPWLADLLRTRYHMKTVHYMFSSDKSIYFPNDEPTIGKKDVVCYVRPETGRRGFDTAIQALILAHDKNPDLHVHFVGSDMNKYSFPFKFTNHGSGSQKRLADILRGATISLIISFTNASLMPLNSINCGSPVVTNQGSNIDWLFDSICEKGCLPTPTELAKKIDRLLNDQELYIETRKRGLNGLSNQQSWEAAYEAAIVELLN